MTEPPADESTARELTADDLTADELTRQLRAAMPLCGLLDMRVIDSDPTWCTWRWTGMPRPAPSAARCTAAP